MTSATQPGRPYVLPKGDPGPPASVTPELQALASGLAVALQSFYSREYGPLAADPPTNPYGGARQEGDRYWSLVSQAFKVFRSGGWVIENVDAANLAQATDPAKGAALVGFKGATSARAMAALASSINGLNLSGSPDGAARADSYADVGKYVIGREYLGAFYKKLRTTTLVGATSVAKVLMDGDSIIVGANQTVAPDVMLARLARARGFPLNVINNGHSGKTTQDWVNAYLPAELAAHTGGNTPDLVIVAYGMNDPDFNETGQAISVAQSVANLRAGLAAMRAGGWTIDKTSIWVRFPTTANDDANGRNEAWREAAIDGWKKACRDYGACLFDAYAFAREVRYGIITSWMDFPYGDARRIHPGDDFGQLLLGAEAEILIPWHLSALYGGGRFENVGGGVDGAIPAVTDLPNSYPFGVSIRRCTGGWPHNGQVTTIYHIDKIAWQICTGYADFGVAVRAGYDATWGAWIYLGPSPEVAATAAAGFTQAGGSPTESIRSRLLAGGMAHMGQGFVYTGTNGVPAVTIAAGTAIATLAAGHRPNRILRGVPLQLYQGSATFRATPGYADISTAGVITVRDAIAETIARVYIGPLSYAVA